MMVGFVQPCGALDGFPFGVVRTIQAMLNRFWNSSAYPPLATEVLRRTFNKISLWIGHVNLRMAPFPRPLENVLW